MAMNYPSCRESLKIVRAIRNAKYIEVKPKDLIVGSFGINLPGKGARGVINWRVSGHRKDKNLKFKNPAPRNPYCDSLFNSMFKRW